MFAKKKQSTMTAAEVPDEAMPPKKELEAQYATLLEELALPEAKRAQMIKTEDDAKKWKLIMAHKKLQKSATLGRTIKTDEPMYWVGLLEAADNQGNPTITPEKAQELETVLRTGHKKFLTEFVAGEGVQSLLALTAHFTSRQGLDDKERLTLQRLMETYKWLMNNQVGMEGMLSIEGSISTLALAMGLGGYNSLSVNLASAKEAVLLLAVTCFYSAKGRSMVVAAMDDMRKKWREASRYDSLVKTFKNAKGNNEFRAACIMFITTIVNSAASVDARVKVRNDFLALDIMNIMSQVVAEATGPGSDQSESYGTTISTQFQVFEDMMIADHREVIHQLASIEAEEGNEGDANLRLNLSSSDDLFRHLKMATAGAGIPDALTELLQALILIPTEASLARPVWSGIVQFTNEATANAVMGKKRLAGKMGKLNYGVLHSILDERLRLDKNLQALASTDEVIKRQRMKIEELTQVASKPSNDLHVKQLEGDIELLRERTVKQSEEITKLKEQLFQAQGRIQALEAGGGGGGGGIGNGGGGGGGGETAQTSLAALMGSRGGGGGGPPPAPVIPAATVAVAPAAAAASSGDPKLEKYNRMKKMGLADGAIMNAMNRDGVPIPPGFFAAVEGESAPVAESSGSKSDPKYAKYYRMKQAGLPDGAIINAMSRDNVPVPPDFFGDGVVSGAAPVTAPAKPKGPQKPVIVPRTKMRGFFWTKVQSDAITGTIWPDLKDTTVKLDLDALDKRFCVVDSKGLPTGGGGGGNGGANASGKAEKIHIVDGKRQQNVGIGISKLRLSNNDLYKAIVTLDETVLNPESLRTLIDMVPTEDEVVLLKACEDVDNLTNEDRFLWELCSIPRLSIRLKALQTKYNFDREALDIKYKLVAIKEGCTEIEHSTQTKILLELVLAIGNYLNGNTPRGQAWGFKLDALGKIEAMKENEGKKNMIHYIVHILESTRVGMLDNWSLLPHATQAMGISISELHNDLRQLTMQVKQIRTELNSTDKDMLNSNFQERFGSFQLKAEKQLTALEVEFQVVLEDFQKLGEKFSEQGPKLEPALFFGHFVKFTAQVKQCYDAIVAARIQAKKLAEAEEEKRRRATLRKNKESEKSSKSIDTGAVDAFQKANQGDAESIVSGFRQRHRAASLAVEE